MPYFRSKRFAPSDVRVSRDLLRDGLGRSDVERPARPDLVHEGLLGRDRESADLAVAAEDLQVVRPELVARLLVGRGDVTGRVHADRQRGSPEALEGLVEELGERREPRRGPADDREHQREPVVRGADDRLGAAADTDPDREGPGFEMWHDILVVKGRARLALPGDRAALEQLGEEVGLLLEEVLVVGEVVAEERERVDAGTSPEDDFRPTAGDRVERRVALEHADRIVRAQDGDGGPDVDPGRARGDRGEHDVGGRQREVVGVVLTDPEEVDADLVGEDALFDEVPDRLRM